MTGVIEPLVLGGIMAVVFGAGPTLSEKGQDSSFFLSGLVAKLSRNYSENKVVQRVDSATGRSTCQ